MKWFKHDARARNDAKLAKIIMRYGIEGYGLYFACLEIIAEELTPENFNFELEHDAELLANMFRMDTLRVERIMRDFIELDLFSISETSGRVACYKLARRLDNTIVQNPEVKKILANFKGHAPDFEDSSKALQSDLKQIRLDKNRLEEKTIGGMEGEFFEKVLAMYKDTFRDLLPSKTVVEQLRMYVDSHDYEDIREAFVAAGSAKANTLNFITARLAKVKQGQKKVEEAPPSMIDPDIEAGIRAKLQEYYGT